MQLDTTPQKISEQPAIKQLLSRMPEEVTNSFTDEQLTHLLTAVGSRSWGKYIPMAILLCIACR